MGPSWGGKLTPDSYAENQEVPPGSETADRRPWADVVQKHQISFNPEVSTEKCLVVVTMVYPGATKRDRKLLVEVKVGGRVRHCNSS